jgi:hypothetical protein
VGCIFNSAGLIITPQIGIPYFAVSSDCREKSQIKHEICPEDEQGTWNFLIIPLENLKMAEKREMTFLLHQTASTTRDLQDRSRDEPA